MKNFSLKNREWKEFFIENLFNIHSGKRLTKARMVTGKTPFVGASDSNNGITKWVSNTNASLDANVLGVNYNGSVVENFYHPYKALFSDDVKRFTVKNKKGNKYLYLFIKHLLLRQKNKYEYGYKFNETRMKRQKIMLPVTSSGLPDYAFMEAYMRDLETRKKRAYKIFATGKLSANNALQQIPHLREKKWKEFALAEIFLVIQRGKRLKTSNHLKGRTPYVSSTGINNGVDRFVGNEEKVRMFKDCLTLANSGSVGSTFYQPFDFIASDHVTKLASTTFTKYVYLFVSVVVSRLREKYSFNREINDNRIKKEKIMLPVNDQNEPDYEYMEQYMRKSEHEHLGRYLNYLEKQEIERYLATGTTGREGVL